MGASTVILIDSGDDESGDEVIITGSSCIPGDVEEVAPPASRPCKRLHNELIDEELELVSSAGGTLLADMAHARGEGPVVVARGCGVYTISGQQPGFVLALSHCQSLSRDPTTTLHPGDCSLHPFKAGQAKRPAGENPRHCANCWCFVCQVLVMRPFALAFGWYPCSQCRSDAVRARSCVWQVPVAQCQQWSQIPAHCNAHGRFSFWVKLRQRQWQNNGDLNTVTNAHHMGL